MFLNYYNLDFPPGNRIDSVVLSSNRIKRISNPHLSKTLTVLDLKNNKLSNLPESISQLKMMKTLDLTNNDLTDLPSDIGFLDKLIRIHLEGNPLKVIKHSIRTAGAEVIIIFTMILIYDRM